MKTKINRTLFGLALAGVCFSGSGCASMIDSAFDQWDYKDKVAYYKDRGETQKTAERAAYEDQFFDHMNQNP